MEKETGSGGEYNKGNYVLPNGARNQYSGPGINELVAAPNTSSWYKTQQGCLRTDPTKIMRRHTFSDAMIPRGFPLDPAPHTRVCMEYRTSSLPSMVDPTPMIETEMNHPQFAFRPVGPGLSYTIDVESQLRRLDQPLGKCYQGVIPEDAPLYRNTVAPPTPMNVPPEVQNAANPISVMVRGPDTCRDEADRVAVSISSRWINNPTRQDTQKLGEPFSPPGVGTPLPESKRPGGVSIGGQLFV